MDSYKIYRNIYPAELVLALNKAQTVSWRLGVAWTLVSEAGDIQTCNGNIFNQHNQALIQDLQFYRDAKKLYISYCPVADDPYSQALLDTLRLSNLIEIHVYARKIHAAEIDDLSKQATIPAMHWLSDHAQIPQNTGISWVRSTRRPWVHIICSNSLGGGYYPLEKMTEQLGVKPYILTKGFESSLLYVQNDRSINFGTQFNAANPQFVDSCSSLIDYLAELSAATVSVVTVVCDTAWLALIVRMSLANEVSYFLSLRSSAAEASPLPPIVQFPEHDNWNINSSEVMGDFMQVVLQKGSTSFPEIDDFVSNKQNATVD